MAKRDGDTLNHSDPATHASTQTGNPSVLTDHELLQKYAAHKNPAAFAEMVRRHAGMVYATCLRTLRDAHAAEDASQAVFLVLARKASRIRRGTNLGGWLYRAADFTAREMTRRMRTSVAREREVAMVRRPESDTPEHLWESVRDHLDEAMRVLPAAQREAIVLRYFSGYSNRRAAEEMGCSEDTLEKRLAHGLARLRARLSRRGVAVTGVSLAALLAEQAHAPVSAALVSSIQSACAAGVAPATVAGLAQAAGKAMAFAQFKTAALVVAAASVTAGAVGTGVALTTSHTPAPTTPVGLPSATHVSRFGFTWTFDRAIPVGRFVTGDPYVVGPVTVRSVTSESGILRGSMVNPGPGIEHGFHPGFDSYRPEREAKFPLVLRPGDSLITASEATDSDRTSRAPAERRVPQLKSAAVLTCLDRPAPADAFRPPFYGVDRPMFSASSLKRELLPRLSAMNPTSNAPEWEDLEGKFERPWIERPHQWPEYQLRPWDNMPRTDHDIARCVSRASLILCLDVPDARKETLLLRFVQNGIDAYGYARKVSLDAPNAAPVGAGRKWVILMSGLMLDCEEMKHPPGRFIEDERTYYGRNSEGAQALWRMGPGLEHEEKAPDQWTPHNVIAERERRASNFWAGQTLAARVMGAERLWNHDAFFDYMDRWMFVKESPERIAAVCAAMDVEPDFALTVSGEIERKTFTGRLWYQYRRKGVPPSAMAGESVRKAWKAYARP